MRQVSVHVCWICLFACVTACGGPSDQAPAIAGVASIDDTTGTVELPGQRLPEAAAAAVDLALLPDNSGEMFERLPAGDREIVENFYRNHGDSVMAFNNKHELLWLIRHGYPLPEDVLEAAAQSEQELQARYDGGDVMAGYFLLDRKAEVVQKTPPDFTTSWKTAAFSEDLLVRGGPFAGYAYYRYHSQLEGSRHVALAGLLWADWRGDYRAGFELMDQTGTAGRNRSDELLGPASVAFAYQALLSGIRLRSPAALGRRIDPLIKYKNGPATP